MTGKLGRELDSPLRKAAQDTGDKASKGFANRFNAGISGAAGAIGRNASRALAGGLVIGGGLAAVFGKQAIDAASDLNETLSKTKIVLGSSADEVIKWSETTAKSLGQSQQSALDAAATFGVFGKSAGLIGPDLGQFSKQMTTLASDMASFSNTSPEEAIEAISSALRGESEPIRKYGVLLDDATLRQQALKLGLIDTVKQALTPQQKVLAAQAEILRQTTDAQGDFARTADGAANKQRILSAQVDNLKAKLGKGLLPIFSGILSAVTNQFLPGIEKIGTGISEFFSSVDFSKLATGVQAGFASLLPQVQRAGSALAKFFTDQVVPLAQNIAKNLIPVLVKVGQRFAEFFAKVIVPLTVEVGKFAATIAEKLIPVVKTVGAVLATFIGFLSDNAGAVKTFAKVVLGLLVARFAALKIKAAVDGVKDFVDTVRGGISTVTKYGKGLASAVSSTATFIKNTASTAIAIGRQTAAFVAQKVAMLAAAAAQKILTAAQWLLNAAMTANPIGLIVTAVVALAAGIFVAYKKFKPFRDIVNAVGRALLTAFNWVKKNWPLILGILTGPFGIAIIVIKKFGPQILSGLKAAFSAIVGFFTGLPAKIVSALGAVGSILVNVGKQILGGLLTGAKFALGVYLAFYVKLPLKILSLFAGAAKWLLDIGKKIVGGLLKGAVAGFVAVVTFFAGIQFRVLRLLASAALWLLEVGKRILGGLLTGVKNGAVAVFSFFTALPIFIVSKIGDVARLLFGKGRDILNGLLGGVKHVAGTLFDFFIGLPNTILHYIGDIGGILFDIGKKIIGGLLDGIKDGIGGLKDTLTGLPGKIIGWKGPPAKDAKLLTPIGELLIGGLIRGIDKKAADLKKTLGKVTGTIEATSPTIRAIGSRSGAQIGVAPRFAASSAPVHNTYEITVKSLDPATSAPLVMKALQSITAKDGFVRGVRISG